MRQRLDRWSDGHCALSSDARGGTRGERRVRTALPSPLQQRTQTYVLVVPLRRRARGALQRAVDRPEMCLTGAASRPRRCERPSRAPRRAHANGARTHTSSDTRRRRACSRRGDAKIIRSVCSFERNTESAPSRSCRGNNGEGARVAPSAPRTPFLILSVSAISRLLRCVEVRHHLLGV
jgi:hypothetical protein